eukprot:Awhi_evm1s1792
MSVIKHICVLILAAAAVKANNVDENFSCASGDIWGYFPVVESQGSPTCRKYFRCNGDGRGGMSECQAGLIFNPIFNNCGRPDDYECGQYGFSLSSGGAKDGIVDLWT